MVDQPAEAPQSLFDKLGAALPIALTALATLFAGLSNSELQQAMLWRAAAAQDQSKATSQWTFAGFKRDRSLICQAAAAQLRATLPETGHPREDALAAAAPQVRQWLSGQGPAKPALPAIPDENLRKLMAGLQTRMPEGELLQQAGAIPASTINAAIDDAERAMAQLNEEWSPTLKAAIPLAENNPALSAAGFELERRRYALEASLNQEIGFLYEARVKISSATSEKHQRKSRNFFYAMLAAQIGAVVASLALARRRNSVLWAVAAGTGVVALVIGGSVYLADL